jgi:TetR/AcrR family tetracycline transcriptional repressor
MGRPPRISKGKILAVARTLDPESLTMQAVAGLLGVDPKALNYHVKNREQLMGLLANDVFGSAVEQLELPIDADWREVVRVYAFGMRDSLVKMGTLAAYITFVSGSELEALRPTETLLQSLLRAGFEIEEAGLTLTFIAEFVFSAARDQVLAQRGGLHPQVTELEGLLANQPGDELPALRQVLAATPKGTGNQSMDFDLRVLIAGLEQLLAERRNL